MYTSDALDAVVACLPALVADSFPFSGQAPPHECGPMHIWHASGCVVAAQHS